MTSWRARGIAVVVIWLVAAGAWGLFGSSTQVDRTKMGQLVVDQTHLPGFPAKPYLDQPQSLTSVPSKILAEAVAKDPDKTGVYSRGWKSSSGNAGFLIQLLPTSDQAKKAKETLQQEYEIKKDYSAAGLTLVGPFDVPGIPDVFAREFTVAASQGSPSTTLDFVIFQVGRVAVSLGVQDVKSSGLRQGTVQLATAEMHLLQREEPGFSMVSTVREPLTALWFALGAIVASLVVVGGPAALAYRRRRKEHRAARALRQEQRHVTSRGGKVLTRRSVPAWQASRHGSRRRRSRARSRR